MSELRIIAHQSAEEAASPEFGYLLSMVELAARRVWPSVRLWIDPTEIPEGAGPVLLLGNSRCYVSSKSLERMNAQLEQGHEIVYPYAVAAAAGARQRPLYTLREFEELETDFFAGNSDQTPEPTSHLPLCLLSAMSVAGVVNDLSVDRLLSDEQALAGRLDVAVDGLAHSFIDYYGERRTDVEPFIHESTRDVLEVGCGGGSTARMLHEDFGCRVTGDELNPAVAERAAPWLQRVIVGDVAAVEIPERSFDLVLALELVEHVPDAEQVLRKLARAVRPGGRLLLSVPNVGHYSVVRDLLAGRWDYLPVGILCYTHYRFFCRTTLEDWLRRCGFENFQIEPQRTEVPDAITRLADLLPMDLESLGCKGYFVLISL